MPAKKTARKKSRTIQDPKEYFATFIRDMSNSKKGRAHWPTATKRLSKTTRNRHENDSRSHQAES